MQSTTLILESDIRPVGSDFLNELVSKLGSLVDDYDLLRLHGIFERNEFCTRKVRDLNAHYSLQQCLGDPMGAGAYIITPVAAKVLLGCSESFYQPVDVFLGATWTHRLRFRTVKPYPFVTADFESVIGDRRLPKQSLTQRLSIEAHRFLDDVKRIAYMPRDFLK